MTKTFFQRDRLLWDPTYRIHAIDHRKRFAVSQVLCVCGEGLGVGASWGGCHHQSDRATLIRSCIWERYLAPGPLVPSGRTCMSL